MNRLQYETSPYLLQHKNNPVDWYPWSEEAFARAREEDKPVLLSVGYSACHWCHVMEHESFEDPETAALMNEHYINIKVDREERPDVDDIYMQATQSFTGGHGGWPMTVFLTPEGGPFHAGTYFPPEPRMGMPSFRQVLLAAADAYHNRREQVDELAGKVATALQNVGMLNIGTAADVEVNQQLLEAAAKKMISRQDRQHGGLHPGQPKFPSPMNLEFLLRYYAQTGDRAYLEPVLFTLQKMAQGGIYDQFGGGFHRYSVDNRWLVPHFEKMLYDNAQLARAYLHAYQVTGEAFYERITREILAYVMREMLDESGGFYSSQDADSEGEEGKFFVWSADEVRSVLADVMNEQEVNAFVELYDITPGGNFEGHNIPNLPEPLDVVARKHSIMPEALRMVAEKGRKALFDVREKRVKPGRDEKILSAWNGMMLGAFAEAARVLDDATYRQVAEENADFLLSELSMDDGRLYRTHKRYADRDGGESKLNGYLEDYANVIDGLLELYQTTFDERWFREAQRLTDHVMAHFVDKDNSNSGFYDTSDDHEQLIARPRNLQDNATPSGNSLMALNLVRLSAYTGKATYEQAALGTLSQVVAGMREYPSAFGVALSGAYLLVNAPVEVALVGDPEAAETRELLNAIQRPFHPRVIIALSVTDGGENEVPPLLNSRKTQQGRPTVYVCQNFVCELPVNTRAEVEQLLAEA